MDQATRPEGQVERREREREEGERTGRREESKGERREREDGGKGRGGNWCSQNT